MSDMIVLSRLHVLCHQNYGVTCARSVESLAKAKQAADAAMRDLREITDWIDQEVSEVRSKRKARPS
jgi:hypothetical protein